MPNETETNTGKPLSVVISAATTGNCWDDADDLRHRLADLSWPSFSESAFQRWDQERR